MTERISEGMTASMGTKMTLGEKIKELRRGRGLSQEELAEQINVSRQAVSKWELDLSLPDIDNIVQLSRLFGISTDQLLIEEQELPDKEAAGAARELRRQQVFALCIGLAVIGLLFSLTVWFTWQTLITVMIGVLLQVAGVIVFEVAVVRNAAAEQRRLRARFYSLVPWLILPFPVKFAMDYLFNYYPQAHNSLLEFVIMLAVYLLLCGGVTYLLQRNGSKQRQ